MLCAAMSRSPLPRSALRSSAIALLSMVRRSRAVTRETVSERFVALPRARERIGWLITSRRAEVGVRADSRECRRQASHFADRSFFRSHNLYEIVVRPFTRGTTHVRTPCLGEVRHEGSHPADKRRVCRNMYADQSEHRQTMFPTRPDR